jgi:hypothetical protein
MEEEIIAALEALMQAAGPEWTLEFLNAGLQEAAQGGQMPPEPEMMSPGGPSAMPPMSKRNALSGQ